MQQSPKLLLNIRIEKIITFLVLWQFFWADNRTLRLYPYIFWPLVAGYSVLCMFHQRYPYRTYPVLLIIAFVYCVCSSLLSNSISIAIMFFFEIILYIPPCIYIAKYCRNRHFIFRIIYTLSLIHLMFIFMQYAMPDVFYPIMTMLNGAAATAMVRMSAANDILVGMTGQSSTISFYLVVGLVSALYFYSLRKNWYHLLTAALYIVGVLLTNRRGNLICAIALVILFLMIDRERMVRKVVIILAAAIGISLIGIENIPGLDGMVEKFTVLSSRGTLLSGREDLWSIALELFENHQLGGIGFMTLSRYIDKSHVHNSYLQKLTELGIAGAVVFFAPFIFAYLSTLRRGLKFRNNYAITNCEYALVLALLLIQTHLFIISLSEGIFETNSLYLIIFFCQFMATDTVRELDRKG